MGALSISEDIGSLIQYIQSLPPLSNQRSSQARFRIKNSFHELTVSEQQRFLQWGSFSIGPDSDRKRQIILDDRGQPFSKKGLKRVIRSFFQNQQRPVRQRLLRKRQRERRRLKESSPSNESANAQRAKYRLIRGRKLREHVQQKLSDHPNSPHIVLDCRFDHLMDHQQMVSVSNQFRQLYGHNMKAPIPCHLYATSFGGRLRQQFRHKNQADGAGLGGDGLLDIWCMHFIEESMETYFADEVKSGDKEFVYLTADSEHVLEQLEEDNIYVIGAFVDKNKCTPPKHKGYTNKLATENGWETARLPIMEHMTVRDGAIKTRLVITVNQVFSIFVAYYNWGDWRKALQFAFPSRKGLVLKERMSQEEIEKLVFDGNRLTLTSSDIELRTM